MDTIKSWWNSIPYSIKGALFRGVRAALAAFVGVLIAALTAGTLFPSDTAPIIVIAVTTVLQAADKWLREHNTDTT